MANFYSPYGPRRRRSGKLVLLWMAIFIGIVWYMWYLSKRGETARLYAAADEFVHPGSMRARQMREQSGHAPANIAPEQA